MKKLLLILIGIILLVSCGKENNWENKQYVKQEMFKTYPAKFRECAINYFMKKYTQEEFLQRSDDQSENDSEIIVDKCRKFL